MNFFRPFHLVTLSPWPIMGSLSLLFLLLGFVKMMNNSKYNLFMLGMIMLLMIKFQWWRDVIRESTFQGFHLFKVIKGIRLGMMLFILSELMFFLSFFWCYFHMFLSPNIEIGELVPSMNLLIFNPYNMPLLNTIILLSSGITITYCHYSILYMKKKNSLISIMLTIFLGMMFTLFQYMEYYESYFTISDSIYGSIFFMFTGFHGIHVLIGTMFIIISYFRLLNNHYSMNHHFGFEGASWYWHFVDIIWLFVYLLVYWLMY
uniref:Cytochrome c oxidase subunit 3 n=1 Tax=Therophilus festivus TaxID=1421599 RepID=A0A0A6ZKT3_9HYME|nr:cytochrome c oxidase subunit III [Therophilus festivus]